MAEDILCSDTAVESGEKPLRQFIPLINKDVTEGSDVPSTGQGIEDAVTKGPVSALKEL